ncbi:MAG: hypothetical protein GQ541_02200 [Desulfovibrionaceae bacterium]|nr:hypothetical protein [Desulfovibrionaceae bacterium]
MKNYLRFFLKFTGKDYSTSYKLLSMLPGSLVFLILSPLLIFFLSRYLSGFIAFSCPRPLELFLVVLTGSTALIFMLWSLWELWITGEGTPAPIAPTRKLVTTGPYKFCRNPIELGTDLYIFAVGTLFASLTTGLLCFFFAILLGSGYIKLIEEQELRLRFSREYDTYYRKTGFMFILFTRGK